MLSKDLLANCNDIVNNGSRSDEWNSDRPKDEGGDRKYEGPAGMEPEGVIDSNWDEVSW